MKNFRWASGCALAIALVFCGCGGSSTTTKDASVDSRGTDGVKAESGGAARDTGTVANLDSGAGDVVVVESGVRDGATERSITTEVGPVLDLAGVDIAGTSDAPTDMAVGGQDSGADRAFSGDRSAVGCPAGYHDAGNGTCVTNGTEGKGSDGGGTGTGGTTGRDGGLGTDSAAGAGGATGTGGVVGTGGGTGTSPSPDAGPDGTPVADSRADANLAEIPVSAIDGAVDAAGSSLADYLGFWVADDPNWDGVAVIDIAKKNSAQLGVHAFGACYPTYCDWGETVVDFIGAPVVAGFSGFEYLTITMNSPTSLHAVNGGFATDYHVLSPVGVDAGSGDGGGGTSTTLASDQAGPGFIAVDPTTVYFTNDDGTVMKMAIGGGSVTILASGQGLPSGIAVAGTNVYWANQGTFVNSYYDGTVMKVAIGGGSVTTLASNQADPSGIAVDGTSVYWTNYRDGTVMKVAIGGGTVTTLASGQSYPKGIAVDGTSAYWTNDDGTVMRVAIAGATPAIFASGQGEPEGITIYGTNLYWTNAGTLANYYRDGTVVKATIAGGTLTTLASGQNIPYNIAVDGTSAYWTTAGTSTNYFTDGTVMKVAIGGGAITTLAPGQGDPSGIAVDGASVYWADMYGTVMKLTPK